MTGGAAGGGLALLEAPLDLHLEFDLKQELPLAHWKITVTARAEGLAAAEIVGTSSQP